MSNEERINKPLCLVILAAFNGENWLREQIDSIFMQEGVVIKLIISDDMSNDSTLKIINDLINIGYDIELIQRSSASGSAGQNFMGIFRDLNFHNVNYIAFSDQDDVWFPFKISRAIEQICKMGASGYSSSVNAVWPDGKCTVLSQSAKVRPYDFLFEGAGQGCTFVITTEFFHGFQKFCIDNKDMTDEFYYHDWLTYLYCRAKNEKWVFDEMSTMNYRQHDNNESGAKNSINAALSRIKLIYSGWYKKQISIAYKLTKRTGLMSPELDEFDILNQLKNSLLRRIRYIFFVLRFGRRKFTDRFIMIIAIILGKI